MLPLDYTSSRPEAQKAFVDETHFLRSTPLIQHVYRRSMLIVDITRVFGWFS